ncbi:MAG: hypothetical protein OEY12_10325 [Nitrospira sp.]|nr:hypothetical protein [Nitrospira sp.]
MPLNIGRCQARRDTNGMGRLVFRHEDLGQYIYHCIKDMWRPRIRGMALVAGLLPLSGIAST